MNLLTMMYTVQQVAQALGRTLEMTIEQYNNYLDLAQKELFREFADGYLQGNGTATSARVEAALAPFRGFTWYNSSAWTVTTTAYALGAPSLVFNLETEVYRVLGAYALESAESYPDKIVKMDIVTTEQAIERMNNSVTYPTADFPIMYLDKDGMASQFIAYVTPTGFTLINVMYLIKPTVPSLVVTYSNDVMSQGGTSVDLLFTDQFRIDIIRIILKYLGISTGNDQIASFVEQQKMNEK